MSADEFTSWAAFYRLEPWGDMRADLRNGVVASLLYNVHRNKEAAPLTPADFMLFTEKPAAETPANESDPLKRRFQALFPGRPSTASKAAKRPRKTKPKKR